MLSLPQEPGEEKYVLPTDVDALEQLMFRLEDCSPEVRPNVESVALRCGSWLHPKARPLTRTSPTSG